MRRPPDTDATRLHITGPYVMMLVIVLQIYVLWLIGNEARLVRNILLIRTTWRPGFGDALYCSFSTVCMESVGQVAQVPPSGRYEAIPKG